MHMMPGLSEDLCDGSLWGDQAQQRCHGCSPAQNHLLLTQFEYVNSYHRTRESERCPFVHVLSGAKQTSLVSAHMSAIDPKRTFALRRASLASIEATAVSRGQTEV